MELLKIEEGMLDGELQTVTTSPHGSIHLRVETAFQVQSFDTEFRLVFSSQNFRLIFRSRNSRLKLPSQNF